MIDWSDPDYIAHNQQFAALVKSVTIKCADPSPGPASGNTTSYVYSAQPGSANSSSAVVGFSDKSTLTDGAFKLGEGGSVGWAVGAVVGAVLIGVLT